VGIEDNNGDAISCIVLMIDSLASENRADVTVQTYHNDDCEIFRMMQDESVSNESINQHEPTSSEARNHLYSCNCDATIETTFERDDGETLMVQFVLSDVKEKHPWLDDPEQTRDMIELASDDKLAPLIEEMKPLFKKRMGRRVPMGIGGFNLKSDTVH